MGLKEIGKYGVAPLALLSGAGYLANNNPEVYEAVGSIAGTVHSIMDPVYNAGVNLASSVPLVGQAAPFAGPMVAGGALGYKLADLLKVENKVLKHGLGAVGVGAGFAASKTVLAPYLAAYGLFKAGKFMYDKSIIPRGFKGLINPIIKVTEASKKMVVDPFIAAKKGFWDNQFEKPNYSYAKA